MTYTDSQITDIPKLADFVARWLQNLRDWGPRCQGLRREASSDTGNEKVVCSKCNGLLWVSVIDLERLFEAIALLGSLKVDLTYGPNGVRQCVIRIDEEYSGEDDSAVGAAYRAAAKMVAAMLDKGILKDTPFDETGH